MTSNPDIRIGVRGRIIAGDDAGLSVRIQDDSEGSGGYLVLVGQDAGEKHYYDAWVKDEESLAGYFREARWVVEWEEGGRTPSPEV